MSSLLCLKQDGGSVHIHDNDVIRELAVDSQDHSMSILMNKIDTRGRKSRQAEVVETTNGDAGMDSQSLIGQTMRVQDWLNEKTVKGLQELKSKTRSISSAKSSVCGEGEKSDVETREARKLYEPLLQTEDTFVKNLEEYITYKDVMEQRKKEMLHKKWNDRVFEPLRKNIIEAMDSDDWPELDRRKRELHKQYLEFTNQKVGKPGNSKCTNSSNRVYQSKDKDASNSTNSSNRVYQSKDRKARNTTNGSDRVYQSRNTSNGSDRVYQSKDRKARNTTNNSFRVYHSRDRKARNPTNSPFRVYPPDKEDRSTTNRSDRVYPPDKGARNTTNSSDTIYQSKAKEARKSTNGAFRAYHSKGHVFLDTMDPEEYYAQALNGHRPSPIKAVVLQDIEDVPQVSTAALRDPLLSQGRQRSAEDRTILRCITGYTYTDKDLEQVKLPPLPLVPLGRHGTDSLKWLEMPLHNIESTPRIASRRRMRRTFNTSNLDYSTWEKTPQDNHQRYKEMQIQRKRIFQETPPFGKSKKNVRIIPPNPSTPAELHREHTEPQLLLEPHPPVEPHPPLKPCPPATAPAETMAVKSVQFTDNVPTAVQTS